MTILAEGQLIDAPAWSHRVLYPELPRKRYPRLTQFNGSHDGLLTNYEEWCHSGGFELPEQTGMGEDDQHKNPMGSRRFLGMQVGSHFVFFSSFYSYVLESKTLHSSIWWANRPMSPR